MCNTRQVVAFWIQAVSFLQLPHSSLRPAGKHSCGKARQKGVKPVSSDLKDPPPRLLSLRNSLFLCFSPPFSPLLSLSLSQDYSLPFSQPPFVSICHSVCLSDPHLFLSTSPCLPIYQPVPQSVCWSPSPGEDRCWWVKRTS